MGDVGDDATDAIAVRLLHRRRTTANLVEECGRGASVTRIVAMLGRQIRMNQLLDSGTAGRQARHAVELATKLIRDCGGDQIDLRREVDVESAICEAGVGHECRDARAVDAVLLEALAGCLENPASRLLFVLFSVSGHVILGSKPVQRWAVVQCSKIIISSAGRATAPVRGCR